MTDREKDALFVEEFRDLTAAAIFRPLAEWQEGNRGLPDDRMPVFLYVREVRDLANWARSLGIIDDRACVCGEAMWAHTESNGCGHPTPAGEGRVDVGELARHGALVDEFRRLALTAGPDVTLPRAVVDALLVELERLGMKVEALTRLVDTLRAERRAR